ncbi:MAG: hypothetical protein M1813_003642 [Trichoglossum hirsutum]|nr:MAG: hypothetical protein M1813_003642 [Trichoglossum hirsutum]
MLHCSSRGVVQTLGLNKRPAAAIIPLARQQRRASAQANISSNSASPAPNSPPNPPPWRPASVLDEYVTLAFDPMLPRQVADINGGSRSYVQREAKPISLRQLTFFGRTLTESRLISSANYVRTELPTRLAHRIRDMQTLPYVVVTNPHMSHVYELYYMAFETLRRVPEIKTVEDNDRYCKVIDQVLQEHLTVIPRLAMGVLECRDLMKPEDIDRFMNTILRARISRRVIAEQHLALTETFNSPWHFADAKFQPDADFIGEVFLRCSAREVIQRCGKLCQDLAREAYGADAPIPEIILEGHLEATFPYILSHLEYIVGELLRNSIQAVVERYRDLTDPPPPIEVLICEAPQHVIIRISDQGGGVPRNLLPHLWSFSKGPRRKTRLRNLNQVPKMAATMQELKFEERAADLGPASPGSAAATNTTQNKNSILKPRGTSLGSLTSRPPNLRLGIGLPMSRVYAEYWAGSLELHSLEGYGVDVFLQISKLGNKSEQLTTRASLDAV